MQPLWAFGIEIWPYPTACGIQCWDTRVQTTNQEGCSTSDQRTAYPKNFLNPQPPLHMPLDTPLRTRGPRPSSTHQWAGSNSFHQEDVRWVQYLGQEDPLGEGMATHSSILACGIPWTEKPGWLQYRGWLQPGGVALSWQTRETGLGRLGGGEGGGEAFPRPRLLGEPF